MTDQSEAWGALPDDEKELYNVAGALRARQQRADVDAERAALMAQMRDIQRSSEDVLRLRGLPNVMSAAQKFTDLELADLAGRLRPGSGVPARAPDARTAAPEEPAI
eukprot:3066596-Pyramimonas_sp.AAC.1